MRNTYWFVALGAVALGLSVLPWSSERAQSQTKASIDGAGVRQALDELSKEIAAERAERKRALSLLESQLLELASDVPAGFAEVVAEGEPEGEPAAEKAPQLPRLQPGQIDPRQKVEAAFGDEPVDSAWAQSTERNLHTVLAQQLKTGSLSSLTCRKTMCRLETTVSDAKEYWQFMAEAFKNPESRIWAGDVYAPQPAEAPGTGEVTLVSYLVREGERMPAPF
jgi:hypothetical protein